MNKKYDILEEYSTELFPPLLGLVQYGIESPSVLVRVGILPL